MKYEKNIPPYLIPKQMDSIYLYINILK
jgi:hypothetical protein